MVRHKEKSCSKTCTSQVSENIFEKFLNMAKLNRVNIQGKENLMLHAASACVDDLLCNNGSVSAEQNTMFVIPMNNHKRQLGTLMQNIKELNGKNTKIASAL